MSDFLYEVDGHLARLTMNRPEHLNCFSEEMIHLWTAALEDIRDRDDIYAVLLSGNGKAFCAGGDVKAMAAGDGFFESHDDITSTALARKNSLWKGIQRIPLILEEIDRPVVAKIHGPAVGAGLDMALMCDVRIAAESASMSESYFNAGIVPGDGGAYFLPRLVGRDRALDMFWTARTVKGEEAERMGLVTRVIPDGALDQFVEEYMQKLLEAPQQAMRLTKRAIHESEQSTLRASLDMVSSFMGIVTELDDYRTRTAALVEKAQAEEEGVVGILGAGGLGGPRAHTVRPYSSNEPAFIAGTVPLIRHDLRSCHLPYPLCRCATSSLPLLAYGHFPLTGGIGPLTRRVGPQGKAWAGGPVCRPYG